LKSSDGRLASQEGKLGVGGCAWNRGVIVGERLAFSIEETHKIYRHLKNAASLHDACLFAVGIDSMLRGSDLLRLRVRDVMAADGKIRWRQMKTGQNVYPVITTTAQDAVRAWVSESGKKPDHYLFTRCKRIDGDPLCTGHLRALIKQWSRAIGLSSKRYSSHSLRRTKPSYLYHFGLADIVTISVLLGHSNTAVTHRYLGISKDEAQQAALAGDIFTADPKATPFGDPLLREFLQPEFLDVFAAALAHRLYEKAPENFDKTKRKGRQ